jgi:hypothetical protein
MTEETADSLHTGTVRAPATNANSVTTNLRKKCQHQHDVEVLFAKPITDVTGMAPLEKKKWQYAFGLLETSSLKEGAVKIVRF